MSTVTPLPFVLMSASAAIALGLGYILLVREGRITWTLSSAVSLSAQFLVLVLCGIAAVRFNSVGMLGVHLAIGLLAGHAIVLLLGSRLVRLETFLHVLLALICVAAVSAWIASPVAGGIAFAFDGNRRLAGIFGNPNQFGAIMAVGAILSTGNLISLLQRPVERRMFLLVLALLTLALCAACCWRSYSRGAWLAALLGLAFLLGKPLARRTHPLLLRGLLALGFFLLAGIFTGWALGFETSATRRIVSTFQGYDFSVLNRLVAQLAAGEMVMARPFGGFGLGQFPLIFENYYKPLTLTTGEAVTNNELLSLTLAAGCLPPILVTVSFFIAFQFGDLATRSDEPEILCHRVACACLLALATIAVLNGDTLFSFVGIFFWIFLNHRLVRG